MFKLPGSPRSLLQCQSYRYRQEPLAVHSCVFTHVVSCRGRLIMVRRRSTSIWIACTWLVASKLVTCVKMFDGRLNTSATFIDNFITGVTKSGDARSRRSYAIQLEFVTQLSLKRYVRHPLLQMESQRTTTIRLCLSA